MKRSYTSRVSVVSEFDGAALGDPRRGARLKKIVAAVQKHPAVGFPRTMTSPAELAGFYRFLANEQVTFEELLEPHHRATLGRLGAHREVLVLHDSTTFTFGGEGSRAGLGPTGRGRAHGFFAHLALAVSADSRHEPLGVIGEWTWVRSEETPTRQRRQKKLTYTETHGLKKETARWGEMVDTVEQRVGDTAALIHVMDSEADDYALLAKLQEGRQRFVIRMCYDRVLAENATGCRRDQRTREFVRGLEVVCKSSVRVSPRKLGPSRARKRQAPRSGRLARLAFTASPLLIQRPDSQGKNQPALLALHAVCAKEIEPPANVEPVEWILFTTEPIETEADILRVASIYRARWTIEEYFKALKTGCAFEKRQLESYAALRKALAVFIPIAWSLLRIRSLSRTDDTAPASAVLTKVQRIILANAPETRGLALNTVRDALLAIARLGGHLKQNGDPGWMVLGRGYEDLLKYEFGFRMAKGVDADL